MLMGVSYDVVAALTPKESLGIGLTDQEICEIITQLGGKPFLLHSRYDYINAILTVPSLNTRGGGHMVYCEEDKVYDPNGGRRDKHFYSDLENLFCFGAIINVDSVYLRQVAQAEMEILIGMFNVFC